MWIPEARRIRRALGLAFIATVASPAAAAPIDLSRAVRIGLERSQEVAVARARVREAEADLRAARLYENPEVEGDVARESPEGKFEWGVGARLPIDIGGQVRHRTAAAEAALRAARLELSDAERRVGAAVAAAYIEAAFAAERARLSEATVALRDRLLQIAQERLAVQDASRLERDLAAAEVATARAALRRSEGDIEVAEARLAGALFMERGDRVEAGRDLWVDAPPTEIGLLVDEAVSRRSDLAALLHRAEAETRTASALYASRWEGTSVGARYDRQWDGEERERVFGVGFAIPLPILNRREGERDAALARADAIVGEVAALRRQVTTEIEAADRRRREAEAVVDLYRTSVLPLTAENASLMEEAYGTGRVSASAVIQAEERYAAALGEYLDALQGRSTAAVDLVASTGGSWTSSVPDLPEYPSLAVPRPRGGVGEVLDAAPSPEAEIEPVLPDAHRPMMRPRGAADLPAPLPPSGEDDRAATSDNAREYRVRAGDSLSDIAGRELGNARRWREIARENDLDPPFTLREGQILRLPEIEPIRRSE